MDKVKLIADLMDRLDENGISFSYSDWNENEGNFKFDSSMDFDKGWNVLSSYTKALRVNPATLDIAIQFEDMEEAITDNLHKEGLVEDCSLEEKIVESYKNLYLDLAEEPTIEQMLEDLCGDYPNCPQELKEQVTTFLSDSEEDLDNETLNETYTKKELKKFKNKTFNQQKVINVYRKKKYGQKHLYAHTRCKNCGREKRVFLSNLIKDPKKYGSCVCSDTNINGRLGTIKDLFKGKKLLSSNTSGYTGVYWLSHYRGQNYGMWRAYIEVDGHRTYLGDFASKSKAVRARKLAAKKGLKWYKDNKDEFMATSRRKHKKTRRGNHKKN